MATNEHQRHAQHISLPVPAGTKSGDPVKVGAFVGVAVTDRREDGTATVWRDGSWHLTVDGAVAGPGVPLYVAGDGTSRITQLTATDTGNTLFGYSLDSKTAAAAPLPVAIAQV